MRKVYNLKFPFPGSHYPPRFECLSCNEKFHHRDKLRKHLKSQHDLIDNDQTYKKHYISMHADIAKI